MSKFIETLALMIVVISAQSAFASESQPFPPTTSNVKKFLPGCRYAAAGRAQALRCWHLYFQSRYFTACEKRGSNFRTSDRCWRAHRNSATYPKCLDYKKESEQKRCFARKIASASVTDCSRAGYDWRSAQRCLSFQIHHGRRTIRMPASESVTGL